MTELDACRILGVEPGTGADEIKRKYRKLMHRVHPDAVLGGGAGEAQEINLAYSVLKQSPGQGSFPIAKGKYMWVVEEDFKLFSLSILRCAKQLLDAREEAEKQRPKKPQPETFRLSAMVETWDSHLRLKLGQPLFPSRMSCHRLYLKDGENREAGYLSFSDDRLYYGVIPLMEQRRVQVRAEVSRKQPEDLGRQIEDLLKKY